MPYRKKPDEEKPLPDIHLKQQYGNTLQFSFPELEEYLRKLALQQAVKLPNDLHEFLRLSCGRLAESIILAARETGYNPCLDTLRVFIRSGTLSPLSNFDHGTLAMKLYAEASTDPIAFATRLTEGMRNAVQGHLEAVQKYNDLWNDLTPKEQERVQRRRSKRRGEDEDNW